MSKISSRSLSLALMVGLCAAGAAMPSLAAPQKKAAAPAPLADLSAEQLANAERVLTGPQQCEFSQTVAVDSYEKKAGYFELQFKGKKYLLAPEPTTTGAVRLEDKKAGIVWLQIANKSMLMNSKAGQRMVDNCVHASQKS